MYDKPPKISLITGERGWQTIEMKTKHELRGARQIFSQLKRIVEDEIAEKSKNIRLIEDRMGAVFDFPEVDCRYLYKTYKESALAKNFTASLEFLTVLPALSGD